MSSEEEAAQDHEEGSEVTPGGSVVYRHQKRTVPFAPAEHPEHLDAITGHIEEHLGPIATVFHELESDLVHVDVHVIAPRDDRPWVTLVTSGMSDAPMRVDTGDGHPTLAYAELMISLPPEWPLEQEAFGEEANFWPIRVLKDLARLPHAYDTWLGWGHSVPNGDPAEPFPGTPFVGSLLLPSLTAPREFHRLELTPERTIAFYAIYPLHPEEMDLKLREGTDALIDRFDVHGIDDVVDPGRPSATAPL